MYPCSSKGARAEKAARVACLAGLSPLLFGFAGLQLFTRTFAAERLFSQFDLGSSYHGLIGLTFVIGLQAMSDSFDRNVSNLSKVGYDASPATILLHLCKTHFGSFCNNCQFSRQSFSIFKSWICNIAVWHCLRKSASLQSPLLSLTLGHASNLSWKASAIRNGLPYHSSNICLA